MSLEVRRVGNFSAGSGITPIPGTAQTNHVDSTYQDIASGSISTDNISQQKIVNVTGVNSTKVVRISAVIPFQVTRRSADTPDYSVSPGVADWQNEEDEDIQWRVVADGDNGWILQVKDTSGDIGVVDWTTSETTEKTTVL